MTANAEIRGKLVLDDAASAVSEKLAHSLHGVGHEASHVGNELKGMLKTAVATALGFQFDRGIHSLKELAEEAFEAAKGDGAMVKQLTSVLMLNDKLGRSYGEVREEATELKDQFEGMAVDMGVGADKLADSFEEIASRSNKTTDQVKEMIGQMVMAGKAVPGGFDAIVSGMTQIEMGMARARNPVVQMITQMGLLKGVAGVDQKHISNAKEVAKQMMKMSPESQLKLAEEAIGRMSGKVKDLPMGFGQLATSMKEMREQIFEAMGVPMLKALTGVMRQLQAYFKEHKVEIEHWAQVVGTKVGEWMKKSAMLVGDAFKYLQTHAGEIKDAIESAMDAVRSTVQFLLDHKEAIAGIWAVNKAYGLGVSAMGAVKAGGGLASMAGSSMGALATNAAAGAVLLAAGYGLQQAAEQLKKLKDEGGFKSEAEKDTAARKDALERMGKQIDVNAAEFDRIRLKFVEQADTLGMTSRAAGEYADSLWKQHTALSSQARQLDEIARNAGGSGEAGTEGAGGNEFATIFNEASKSHNAAMIDYAAKVLAGSESLFNAFLSSGAKIEGGYTELATAVEKYSPDFAKILKTMPGEGGEVKHPLTVNMNGGQTFHIKQDFRDKDPDRIALIFRRDITRAALNRTSSRMGTPFGM